MSSIESARISAIVEEALEKLSFLASITPDIIAHRDELSQIVGDEITRIIQEQRSLEQKYEELIRQRTALKALSNKAKYKENQEEIRTVARALRESTKELCRNLKGNPNIAENLSKIQGERSNLQNLLSKTLRELRDNSHATLTHVVEEEKARNDMILEVGCAAPTPIPPTVSQRELVGTRTVVAGRLRCPPAQRSLATRSCPLLLRRQTPLQNAHDCVHTSDALTSLRRGCAQVIAKEKEVSAMVKQLQADLAVERQGHRQDIEERSETISKLKDELSEIRATSAVKVQYLAREARARCQSVQRAYSTETANLEQEIWKLRKELEIEERANRESEEFLRRKQAAMGSEITVWMNRYESEMEEHERELEALKARRAEDLVKLHDYTERYEKDMSEKAEREEEERQRVEMEAIKAVELERNSWAAIVVQAIWRGYLARQAASGGKGKKGKGAKGKGGKGKGGKKKK